ncbi:hypothetical protein [Streptomyces sp. DSM 15324]|uniref:hypothetical protein n=1 Tax=Streptomyces sp. DSM 15324 TaxID=1739111 RepID=UPI000AC2234D|nr:hypothetical protein [Streptomyces sp. DSM 15324]
MMSPLTSPLTLPASLMAARRVDPAGDGWRFVTHHAVGTPAGDTYVLSGARRYRWEAEGATDPAEQNFGCRLLTRYGTDGRPVAVALYGQPRPDGTPSAVEEGTDPTLAVLPDGTVAVSSKPGSTHLISADLSRVLASWRMPWGWQEEKERNGDPYAASISVTPSGRLLCVTSEYGLSDLAGAHPNIVALSEPGERLAPGSRATLRALATHDARTERQTDADLYAHVRHRGAPVGRGNRPSPSLTEIVSRDFGRPFDYRDCTLGRPAALGDDLFVVPVFGRLHRSGNRGQVFTFALLDDRGAVRGRLEGLHRYEDSPFTGFCFTVVGDPYRARAFHLNRFGLYAWSADGRLRSRMSTEDKPYKALTHFTLLEATPAGELLLAHRGQHLLLRVPVPEDLDGLAAAVEAALKSYARGRTAWKKEYAPVNWHWVDGSARVHHL